MVFCDGLQNDSVVVNDLREDSEPELKFLTGLSGDPIDGNSLIYLPQLSHEFLQQSLASY